MRCWWSRSAKRLSPNAREPSRGATSRGRRSCYFRHPDLPTGASNVALHPKLELRGTNGLIVAPPSIHASGKPYFSVQGQAIWQKPLPEVPPQIFEVLQAAQEEARHSPAAGRNDHRQRPLQLRLQPLSRSAHTRGGSRVPARRARPRIQLEQPDFRLCAVVPRSRRAAGRSGATAVSGCAAGEYHRPGRCAGHDPERVRACEVIRFVPSATSMAAAARRL